MTDRRRGARLVLGSGVLLGLAHLAYYLSARPDAVGLDYRVYHVAAEAALAGGDIYAVSPPGSGFTYQYPPATVAAFLPSAFAGSWIPGFVVHTAITVAASVVAAWLLGRYLSSLDAGLGRVDRWLVGAFLVASVHAVPSLVFGQVNHYLAAALVAGFVALERARERAAGVLFGLAAFVKVFPALVGAWLLRRRSWTAIATATGTALALTVVGAVAFGPGIYRTYLTDILLPRQATGEFAGGLDPAAGYVTLRRPLSVLFPGVDPAWYAAGAIALLVPAVALTYRDLDGPVDRLVAIHATLTATLLALPSLLVYYVVLAFPLVALLYVLEQSRTRRLFVAGALLANLSLSFGGFRRLLTAVDLPAGIESTVLAAVRPVLALGTPVLWGSLLMLVACLSHSWPAEWRPS